MTKASIIIAAVCVSAIRPWLPVHPASLAGSYEATAHLFVGGLIGAWLANRDKFNLWVAGGMSLVEVACAVKGFL